MNYKKLAIILFLLSTFYFLPFTSSVVFADWDEWNWQDSKESTLSNHYREEGIKFYKKGRYKQAEQAFRKALLIDSECEMSKKYLSKLKIATQGVAGRGLRETGERREVRDEIKKEKSITHYPLPITQFRKDDIEKEQKRLQVGVKEERTEEIEGWEEYDTKIKYQKSNIKISY